VKATIVCHWEEQLGDALATRGPSSYPPGKKGRPVVALRPYIVRYVVGNSSEKGVEALAFSPPVSVVTGI